MSDKKHNKKLPKDAVSEQEIDPEYGHVFGHWDECGGHNFTYRNFEEPDNVFDQIFNPDGSFSTSESNSDVKQIRSDFYVGEHRAYHGGGKSIHADSHIDVNTEATHRTESKSSMAVATADNFYHGVGGNKTEVAGNQMKIGTGSVAGGAEGYTDGKAFTTDGLFSVRSKKKIIMASEEETINMVGGDHAIYIKGGYEVYAKKDSKTESEKTYYIETGQKFSTNSTSDTIMKSGAKITANAQSDISITSQTKITLKVGGSSIVIESGSITIKSSQIKFEQG